MVHFITYGEESIQPTNVMNTRSLNRRIRWSVLDLAICFSYSAYSTNALQNYHIQWMCVCGVRLIKWSNNSKSNYCTVFSNINSIYCNFFSVQRIAFFELSQSRSHPQNYCNYRSRLIKGSATLMLLSWRLIDYLGGLLLFSTLRIPHYS